MDEIDVLKVIWDVSMLIRNLSVELDKGFIWYVVCVLDRVEDALERGEGGVLV